MDILKRLRDSSPNEGSHDLQCRCIDAANEIERLRAALSEITPAFNMCRMIMDSQEARDDAGEIVQRCRAVLAPNGPGAVRQPEDGQ